MAVALSALWMTLFYPRQPGTGVLAYLFRLAFGAGMAASIILSFTAIRRRFLTAAGFGLPLHAAVDVFPPGNLALGLVGIVLACASALGCYLLAVRLGERRWASELAARSALSGLVVGAMLGLLMMAVLMGAIVATGL